MRFVYGEPPRSVDFNPAAAGWVALKEPSPLQLALAGSALGIPLAVPVGLAWKYLVPGISLSGQLSLSGLGPAGRLLVPLALLLSPFVLFALLVLAHEFCHAFGTPRFGFSRDTIIGAWPRKLLFYAGYLQELSRNRYLLYAVMPFLVLTVAPLLVAMARGGTSWGWPVLSVLNALFSGGDLVIISIILAQIPGRAVIRNQEWSTWWRPGAAGEKR
jgi:hypothetical protein